MRALSIMVVAACAFLASCDALSPRTSGSRPPDRGAAAAQATGLVAKWKIVAEERGGRRREIPPQANWTMDFQKGGKLSYCKLKCKEGTWSVKGDQLLTTIANQTRTVTFKIEGDRLSVVSGERGDWRLILERVRQ